MALRSLRGAAIVSGGASGLGRACVERLHGEGLRVLIADLVVAIARNPMLNGETIRLDGAIRMAPR